MTTYRNWINALQPITDLWVSAVETHLKVGLGRSIGESVLYTSKDPEFVNNILNVTELKLEAGNYTLQCDLQETTSE